MLIHTIENKDGFRLGVFEKEEQAEKFAKKKSHETQMAIAKFPRVAARHPPISFTLVTYGMRADPYQLAMDWMCSRTPQKDRQEIFKTELIPVNIVNTREVKWSPGDKL